MGTGSSSMARTGWWKGPWSGCGNPASWIIRRDTTAVAAGKRAAAAGKRAPATRRKAAMTPKRAVEALASEPVPHLHPQAGGNIADDGRRGTDRRHGFPATAGVRAASGGLPHHTDPDLLSGREPG